MDKQISKNKEIIKSKLLFGIPIIVKDFMFVKGLDSTYGIVRNCFKPLAFDGTNTR